MMTLRLNLNKRLSFGFFLASLLTFVLLAAFVFSSWREDWRLSHKLPQPILAKKVENNEMAQLIEGIPHSHLFGQPIKSVGNVPLTNLQFRLTGIVHSDNTSKAYIAIGGQPSKIYRTGDIVPNSEAKIFAITDDTVIIQNEGRLEKITLTRQKLQFKNKTTGS